MKEIINEKWYGINYNNLLCYQILCFQYYIKKTDWEMLNLKNEILNLKNEIWFLKK